MKSLSKIFLRRGCTSKEWRHWTVGKQILKANTKGGGDVHPLHPPPRSAPEQDLDRLFLWSETWQLIFNVTKCYHLGITSKRTPIVFDYSLNEKFISREILLASSCYGKLRQHFLEFLFVDLLNAHWFRHLFINLIKFQIYNFKVSTAQSEVGLKQSTRLRSYPIDSCAAGNRPWRALAFLPLLTLSLLTKIGIIYTLLLREKKIFPMMPSSHWSGYWKLKYAQKCSKSWAKNSEPNFLPLHLAAPW